MVRKSLSESSKEYRARKKAGPNAEQWRKKESARVMKYYTPASKLTSGADLLLRRERNRLAQERRRAKLKARKEAEQLQQQQEQQVLQATPTSASTCSTPTADPTPSTSSCTSTPATLAVKFNFVTPRSAHDHSRKRTSRAVAKAHRRISKLQDANKKSTRQVWKLQKRLQRMKQKFKKLQAERRRKTPKESALQDLMKAGLDPISHQGLLRKLTIHHALMAQIKAGADRRKTKKKDSITRVLSGHIARKYHILRYVGMHTGVNRNHLSRKRKTSKRRMPAHRSHLQECVVTFLERDDNSRIMPGKKDSTRLSKGLRMQTRVLTDYLHNLWSKFTSEHPERPVSLAVFCKMRPAHIKLTAFASRSSCLCIYHQNIVLKLKAGGITTNPDALIKDKTDSEILEACFLRETVTYYNWDKERTSEDRSHVRCMRKQVPQNQFKEQLLTDLHHFRGHAERIHVQYQALKMLKESLQPSEAIVLMDFSENYTCKNVEEVQSAYWCQMQVTLHPVVIYRKEGSTMTHKSAVYVSDVSSHGPTTVTAIIKAINEELDKMSAPVEVVHYVTDGPSSQYRNKVIFYLIANHTHLFLRSATWSYHEVGHGKGPCDGIGGTLKRMADDAVKQGKAVISSADQFHEWLTKENPTKITSHMFTQEDVDRAVDFLSDVTLKTTKGTMTVHAVKQKEPGVIAIRDTSCFCQGCHSGEDPCQGWTTVALAKHQERITTKTGAFVAALTSDSAYFGRIEATRRRGEEEEVKVTFLLSREGSPDILRWPRRKDVLWVQRSQILCNVPEPTALETKGDYTFSKRVMKKVAVLLSDITEVE